ncbi:MAG: ATP-binding protein, partial [Bacteroidetes bacterium]|nr:ATP-binding protein [Bacteroidota bacterium]
MNQQNTIERMKQMRLGAMAQVHYNNLQNNLNMDLTIDQYTSLLVDQEWENRQGNKIKKLITTARFRSTATLSDI